MRRGTVSQYCTIKETGTLTVDDEEHYGVHSRCWMTKKANSADFSPFCFKSVVRILVLKFSVKMVEFISN